MKTVSLACRVLAAALGVAVLALMFFGIVHIAANQGTFELSAAQLAFGSNVTAADGSEVELAKSAWFFFDLVMAVLAVVCAVAAFFKGNKAAAGALGFGIVNGIMMILFLATGSHPGAYVDYRYLTGVKNANFWYNNTFIVLFCLSMAFILFTVVSIFVADYVAVKESNGAKKLLWKRFKSWLTEYKGELKKITWPTFPVVVRNTIIVLILCAVVGVFIWAEDLGLGQLLKLIFKT